MKHNYVIISLLASLCTARKTGNHGYMVADLLLKSLVVFLVTTERPVMACNKTTKIF